MIAPCSCAHAASFSTGLIVPSVFETRLFATTFTLPRDAISSSASSCSSPRSSIGMCANCGAGALGDELPGHEVGVVLELGDHDDVAGAEVLEPPRIGDEVSASVALRVKITSRFDGALT